MQRRDETIRTAEIWAVNFASRVGDVEYNGPKIIGWIGRVGRKRTYPLTFLLFPEAADSFLPRIAAITEKHTGIAVLIGHTAAVSGGTVIRHSVFYNGSVLFSRDKTVLSPTEERSFIAGGTVESCTVEGIRFGILLCYENHFPELAAVYGDEGCDIIFAPFASPREHPKEKYKRFLPPRAYDNTCFLAACNLIQDFPKTGNSPGTGLIINPKGEVIAGRVSRREEACRAVIDLGEVQKIRSSKMGHFRGRTPPLM